jgi:hypothetical protein
MNSELSIQNPPLVLRLLRVFAAKPCASRPGCKLSQPIASSRK